MRDTLPIHANLEKDRIRRPPTEMNCDSKGIRHDDQISEYATAAKEHIPITSNKLHRSESLGNRLKRIIQCHE
jgi:hypothetical protein